MLTVPPPPPQPLSGSPSASPLGTAVQQAIDELTRQHPWIDELSNSPLIDSIARVATSSIAQQLAGAGSTAPTRLGLPAPGAMLKGLVKSALNEVLLLVADVLAMTGNGTVRHLREEIMPNISRFVGDTWAYLYGDGAGQPNRIQERITRKLQTLGRGQSQATPISVVAHSFGGVIAFHMAVRQLLWIDSFITFGSQPSLFEVIVRNYGPAPYASGRPVGVGGAIRKWINLWEPLDVLAFAQQPVFGLPNNTTPLDERMPHLHDSGLLTHSVYWRHPLLAQVLRTAL